MDKRKTKTVYVAVVQYVLLFGSKTWVLTPWLEKNIEVFGHRTARRMSVMVHKCQWGRTWVYPPIGVVLEMVGL